MFPDKTAANSSPVPRWFRRAELFLPLALLLLVLTGIFSFRSWQQYEASTRDVQISRDILDHTGRLLTALDEAETGQRGFLLTGREKFLQPYTSGARQAPLELEG